MNKKFANGENQFLKVDNAVPSLDNNTYYLMSADANSIIIKCKETNEKRTFTTQDIEYKLQHSYYRQSLDNDKYKFLFHLQTLLQNGVENSKKQRTYSYHEMALAHSHGYSLCLGSSHDLLEFEDWIKTLMANSELQK